MHVRLALLALPLVLAACGSPALDAPGDPYADGVSHAWSDGAGLTSSGAVKPASTRDLRGTVFLGSLTWASASNGWGPIEKDVSNGESAAGDGRRLSIDGRKFAKGLGMHADARVTYRLGGACRTFAAFVGIDDEVGNRGSAVFRVLADGTLKFDSGVLRGADGAKSVNVDVSGAREVTLVTTDAGDGIAYDHANWADARVACTGGSTFVSSPPSGSLDSSFATIQADFAVRDTAVQPDGKLLVLGHSSDLNSLGYVIARYNADGTPDLAFGTNGRTTLSVGSLNYAASIAVQSDGKIVASGRSEFPKPLPDIGAQVVDVVMRLTASGQRDVTFGSNGVVILGRASGSSLDLASQPDGKMLLVQGAPFSVLRLLPDGTRDFAFGPNGRVDLSFDVPSGETVASSEATRVASQSDGRIVLSGVRRLQNTDGSTRSEWLVARLTSNGTLDSSFDADGRLVAFDDSLHAARLTDLVVGANGDVALGGQDHGGSCVGAALHNDGALAFRIGPDVSFVGYGNASLAYQADGRLLVACQPVNVAASQGPLVSRVNVDGTLDTAFGTNGSRTVGDAGGVLVQPGGKIVVGWQTITRLNP
ncbi:NPCBM/NEW2 domain-containing protein [Deinococcus yavapaiensis]|uniref:Putative delta-60 repeat protein n=1 Tax=Deinococcus yavapaiensis KR-236 TaxID=694435 RepID=A0A318SFV4_9DEIO|nr:NPCBM/NEW2 domain-containing protein [Deinococcus yavapaiensis]PYE55756.1 putative delta-60 repeat protein [Deinococcus yavapaiensis KR-236]